MVDRDPSARATGQRQRRQRGRNGTGGGPCTRFQSRSCTSPAPCPQPCAPCALVTAVPAVPACLLCLLRAPPLPAAPSQRDMNSSRVPLKYMMSWGGVRAQTRRHMESAVSGRVGWAAELPLVGLPGCCRRPRAAWTRRARCYELDQTSEVHISMDTLLVVLYSTHRA